MVPNYANLFLDDFEQNLFRDYCVIERKLQKCWFWGQKCPIYLILNMLEVFLKNSKVTYTHSLMPIIRHNFCRKKNKSQLNGPPRDKHNMIGPRSLNIQIDFCRYISFYIYMFYNIYFIFSSFLYLLFPHAL